MECLFCDIANKKKVAHIIYEDDFVTAVLDVFPRAVGHTLVLPKKHCENILDLPSEEMGPVFNAVKKITALLKEKLSPDGFTIGINHGKVSGQSVEHLHIHIMPRFLDDGGGSVHSVVNKPPKVDLEEVKKIINQ